MLTTKTIVSLALVFLAPFSTAFGQAESDYPTWCQQALQNWEPYPEKSDFMVFTAHPDDEGIFFGGALPYYTQVQNKSTILIGMTGTESNHAGLNRREELERAAWHYGVQHQPINFQYPDVGSNVFNQWEPQEGEQGVINRLATEIRRYKPDVLLTHDFNGEYGHAAHVATASAVADAYDVAADPNVDLEGLAPWQAQKLYIHLYNSPGDSNNGNDNIPDETVSANGFMYHSWEEQFPELGGKSSRDIANEGLLCHLDPVRVWPDLDVISREDDDPFVSGWALHYAEDWGLYRSEVGPDTVDSDFFQNVTELFFPEKFGDLTDDQQITVADWVAFKASVGDDLSGLSREASYLRGDVDFDGDNDIDDFRVFRSVYNAELGAGAFESIAANVPEPSSIGIATILLSTVSLLVRKLSV